MKNTHNSYCLFKSKFMDVANNMVLMPTLHSSFFRNSTTADMAFDEKSLLFYLIVEQSSNAVVITDDLKRIVYVNNKFEQISGYTSDEILGKNLSILRTSKIPAKTYREMHSKLEAKQQWRGELINCYRHGREYTEEIVISPITNTSGDIVYFFAETKDITVQKNAEKSIQKLRYFDNLTGVSNRDFFIEEIEKLAELPAVKENYFSVLFIGLNRFKELNDTYGHLAGDIALRNTAERIEKVIPSNDFLARLGGDEFVIVHNKASMRSTVELANKLIELFHSPIVIDNQEHFLSVSIGSALWPSDGVTIRQILSRADLAMSNGKMVNRSYTSYTKAIGLKFSREFELARKLDLAVQKKQFSLVYQPKVDLTTGCIRGMEALLRWNDPEFGRLSPAEFIPIAEKYKKMTSIGKWVVTEVCQQLNHWKFENKIFYGRIAINISVQQIENDHFYENILSILRDENISPSMIELEVTESLLISEPDRAMALFLKLKSVGFSISIDDFGTGYSSLVYLTRLKADTIKIDKSFIDNITTDNQNRAIVKSIIELGHNLSLTVIAEGVETREQLDQLTALNCDVAQGYFFSKPLPADEIFPFIGFQRHLGKSITKVSTEI